MSLLREHNILCHHLILCLHTGSRNLYHKFVAILCILQMNFHTMPPPSEFQFLAGAEICIFSTVSILDLRTTHVSYPLCTRDRMARAWTWPVTPSSANVQKIWNYRLCPFLNTSVSSWWAKQATMKYRDNFMSYFTVTWVVTHRILTMQTQGTQFDLQCLKLDWGWLLCSIFILLVPPAITISYLPTIPRWTNLLVIHPIVL